MTSWPDEYEDLRTEARDVARSVRELYAGNGNGGGEEAIRSVEAQREALAVFEQDSPAGTDEEVGGVPCRVFNPEGARGVYLHLHGGAMMLGSPRMNDLDNAAKAEALDVAVVSVDYRLAPEHPFPAGSDDCLAVAASLLAADDRPMVVGGESAGAYYAALALLRVRDELGLVERVRGANLIFGIYDLSGTPSNLLGQRPATVPDLLAPGMIESLLAAYLPGRSAQEAKDPAVSPLYADLTGLPPALFTVGTADHLLDDTLFMAARWQAWGNEAELALYPDAIHGFVGFPMALARRANQRILAFLDRSFG